ncbi:MAG TPA: GNAT family N-acetyltransferase [Kofleriaceae bacterium]|jgi:GNAT superfamily N-acetyltransferase
MDPRIRIAIAADIPAMKLIRDNVRENALVTRTIGESDYAKAMAVGRAWVALDGDEVVGFACARLREGDVWALFVRESHEVRGLGTALMNEVEAFMFANGIDPILLTTAPGTRAERLYRKRGWIAEPALMKSGDLAFSLRKRA